MAIILNTKGIEYAKKLIEKGKVDLKGSWSVYQPDAEQQDAFLESNSIDDYARWFLAINTDAKEGTKARYEFPYGDFSKVCREGIVAAEKRASQYGHTNIEQAAHNLLHSLDAK